jgi:hypothetical protein
VSERLFSVFLYGLLASIAVRFVCVHLLIRTFVREGISASPRYSRFQFPLDLRAWKAVCRDRGRSFGAAYWTSRGAGFCSLGFAVGFFYVVFFRPLVVS